MEAHHLQVLPALRLSGEDASSSEHQAVVDTLSRLYWLNFHSVDELLSVTGHAHDARLTALAIHFRELHKDFSSELESLLTILDTSIRLLEELDYMSWNRIRAAVAMSDYQAAWEYIYAAEEILVNAYTAALERDLGEATRLLLASHLTMLEDSLHKMEALS